MVGESHTLIYYPEKGPGGTCSETGRLPEQLGAKFVALP